jgi:hypothetical protein
MPTPLLYPGTFLNHDTGYGEHVILAVFGKVAVAMHFWSADITVSNQTGSLADPVPGTRMWRSQNCWHSKGRRSTLGTR